jgi:hypothetical protein
MEGLSLSNFKSMQEYLNELVCILIEIKSDITWNLVQRRISKPLKNIISRTSL